MLKHVCLLPVHLFVRQVKLLLLCDGAFMCPQKRDVSSEDKEKFPYDIVKMALPPEAQLAADTEVQTDQ